MQQKDVQHLVWKRNYCLEPIINHYHSLIMVTTQYKPKHGGYRAETEFI